MLRDKVRKTVEGKGQLKSSSTKHNLSEHLWPAPRMCTHHKVQYEIFTSSAPDTVFIFVEAKPPRRPAAVKVSTQQKHWEAGSEGSGGMRQR